MLELRGEELYPKKILVVEVANIAISKGANVNQKSGCKPQTPGKIML